MSYAKRVDPTILLRVLAGLAVGVLVGLALLLWAVPAAVKDDYRPAVLSTLVVPLGLLLGWLLSGSRERAATAAVTSLGLYFFSAFVAARLRTLPAAVLGTVSLDPAGWDYFWLVAIVQAVAGLGIAVVLALLGRGWPRVERLKDAGDVAGLEALLQSGSPAERGEAARALGSLDEAAVRPALLSALDDGDAAVTREVLGALVGLATAADRPRLEALRQHPDPAVRRRAREALRWVEKT